MNNVDPSSSKRKEAKGRSKAAFQKLGLTEPLDLSEHEEVIMSEVIGPSDIASAFSGRRGLATCFTSKVSEGHSQTSEDWIRSSTN